MNRLIILYIQFKGSRQIRVDPNFFCESPSENWGIKSLGTGGGKICLFYHFSDVLLKRECAFFSHDPFPVKYSIPEKP
ncbi:hypothetical protein BsIDN1_19080 [Bacillus safensis]|uniref:Uncharacterized protein n=1 Tax=Bacillus safensis TaxID=561879 RepID=A0A5S9M3X6_BACIA|nr:hypothetical protein BsIDN1_19080 [Bacillus safensis]